MSNYSTSYMIRFFLLALLVFAGQALSGQKIWTNGNGTGIWSDPDNWNPSGVPTIADGVVRFNNTSDTDCTIDIDAEAFRLVIAGVYDGNVDLGSNTLTVNGDFTVPDASQFTAGVGSKVIITDAAGIDCAASLYDLEINTDQTTDNVAISQDLTINNDLTIIQVNNVNGSGRKLKVSADIILNDADLTGSCHISANGACTITGTQLERLNVEAGASLQLLSDITLTNTFSLTGGGTITGSNKLILGSNGDLDFSGTVEVPNVEINTTTSIDLVQDFNITGDLDIIQIGALRGIGNELRVSGDIIVTDGTIGGTAAVAATLVLAGSGANSFQGTGGGVYRHLAVDKDNASDVAQLNSSDEFFSLTVKKGILDLNGQSPEITNTSATINSGGTLAGNGTITGAVNNDSGGKVSPGNSVGTININP